MSRLQEAEQRYFCSLPDRLVMSVLDLATSELASGRNQRKAKKINSNKVEVFHYAPQLLNQFWPLSLYRFGVAVPRSLTSSSHARAVCSY